MLRCGRNAVTGGVRRQGLTEGDVSWQYRGLWQGVPWRWPKRPETPPACRPDGSGASQPSVRGVPGQWTRSVEARRGPQRAHALRAPNFPTSMKEAHHAPQIPQYPQAGGTPPSPDPVGAAPRPGPAPVPGAGRAGPSCPPRRASAPVPGPPGRPL